MAIVGGSRKTFPKQTGSKSSPYATKEEILKNRVVKDIGFGIKTPETAYEDYVDPKCPFVGDFVVRGRLFEGKVIRMKAEKTIVVQINYLHYVPKYSRYERRNTRINVHLSPCWNGLVQLGDTVKCGETRPMSKTKASAVIGIVSKAEQKTAEVFSF